MRPFLKWAGGKYRIHERLLKSLPSGQRLVEPFVGSGAVFMNTDYLRYLLADTNPDLIGCYGSLRAEPEALIDEARRLFTPKGNTQETFRRLRDRFNKLKATQGGIKEQRKQAALFIYLNRHCFNGLCRYNRSGAFNVPFGRYTKPYFPEKEMRAFGQKLQQAELRCCDFRQCFEQLQPGDVVYCDPPYVPLSATANFTSYSDQCFTLADQESLNSMAQSSAQQGLPVVISNHETAFTKKLYQRARRDSFPVRRFISCKGDKREQVRELVAVFG